MASEPNTRQLSMVFNEVRPIRGFEDIVIQVQDAIIKGQLKAGDRLPNERELGGLFGVSRPTLREAIRVLEADGMVEVRRGTNGGTFIAEPKAQQVGQALAALIRFRGATVMELAEFRGNFEAETAYWAAKRATPQQIVRLTEIASRFAELVAEAGTPWSKLVELDIAFHEEVAYASQNQIRVAIMLAIHGVLHKTSLSIGEFETTEWRQQQVKDLDAVVQAIARRQFQAAKRLMREHVMRNVKVEVDQELKPRRGRAGD